MSRTHLRVSLKCTVLRGAMHREAPEVTRKADRSWKVHREHCGPGLGACPHPREDIQQGHSGQRTRPGQDLRDSVLALCNCFLVSSSLQHELTTITHGGKGPLGSIPFWCFCMMPRELGEAEGRQRQAAFSATPQPHGSCFLHNPHCLGLGVSLFPIVTSKLSLLLQDMQPLGNPQQTRCSHVLCCSHTNVQSPPFCPGDVDWWHRNHFPAPSAVTSQ